MICDGLRIDRHDHASPGLSEVDADCMPPNGLGAQLRGMPPTVAEAPKVDARPYHGPTRAHCARRGRGQSAKALNHTVIDTCISKVLYET